MPGTIRNTMLAVAVVGVMFPAPASGQESPSPAQPLAEQPARTAPRDTPTLAIVEFDFAAVHQWWAVELEIGRGIADLITDGLVNDGTYRVIERRFLTSVLAEQNLAADSRRSDPSAANLARVGKLAGAQYLVVGSVTSFGTEKESKGGGGGTVRRAIGVGLVGREKGKAVVTISARVVDASTGVVVASVTGAGKSSRSGMLLGGLGSRGFGGVSMRSDGFRETILSEAIADAVRQLVEALIATKPRLTRP